MTRQVKFDSASEKSLDMVLSLNGLPIATVELKNPLTAQNVQHAIEQYKNDRDPRLPIFQFKKRALVHFAVDPDLVYMTTGLEGKDTFFLPFNKGNGTAAGNPEGTRATRRATSGRRSGSATASSTSSAASSTSRSRKRSSRARR